MAQPFLLLPLFLLLAPALAPAPGLPSDPAGVYALIDKVTLLPDDQKPTRVEIDGVFCVAAGHGGDYYRSPVRGRLSFTAGEKPEQAVQEWRDLAKLASTGKVATFGSRYAQHEHPPRVVAAGQAPGDPLAYPIGWGVRDVGAVDYGPTRELRLLPTPLAPLDTAAPKASADRRPVVQVTFECRNCVADEAGLNYVFEVQRQDGERFASPAVPAGKDTTKWATEMVLVAGERIVWRVHVLHAKAERTPVAEASFVVGQAAAK